MILEKGNMWDVFGKTDLFLITTNPIVRKDGAAVMGRGIAKEAAVRFPDMPYIFGFKLESYEGTPSTGIIGTYEGQIVGFFMVKDHWRAAADLSIITKSVASLISSMMMKDFVTGKRRASNRRVDLNFPGIGNGKLKREDVLPIIEQLPDNVHVWELL